MQRINWQEDLDQLAKELPGLHKNLFFQQDGKDFYNRITALKKRLGSMDNYGIVMEIARIVASIGDAHTAVSLPRYNRLPLECYWFQEGIFITAALPEFSGLVHCKVVAVQGLPIGKVIEDVAQIVSYENQSFLRSQLPEYLICADILLGLGIADDIENITLTLENGRKERWDATVPVIKYTDGRVNAWQKKLETPEHLPLYRRNKDKYFWREFDLNNRLLYVNYNKCKDMQGYTVKDFSDQLVQDLNTNPNIQKIVIDMRNNGGGNSELFRGYLDWLSNVDRLNSPGRIFAIVGRDTFSSALLNAYYLKSHTHALFLGEPTGGKPNCYGEVQYLSLKTSGLYIRYSTKYYDLVDDDSLLSFMPDVICHVTFDDYINNIDPCMEWIYQEGFELPEGY